MIVKTKNGGRRQWAFCVIVHVSISPIKTGNHGWSWWWNVHHCVALLLRACIRRDFTRLSGWLPASIQRHSILSWVYKGCTNAPNRSNAAAQHESSGTMLVRRYFLRSWCVHKRLLKMDYKYDRKPLTGSYPLAFLEVIKLCTVCTISFCFY